MADLKITEALAQSVEAFAQVREAADGLRRQMETAGWSAEASERVAERWLTEVISLSMRGVGRG